MNSAIRALAALALIACVLPARAETHALIMTIGAYKGGVPPLQGVRFDADSARTIAQRMGVKDSNMRYYKDDQLTLEGMRKAFADLDDRVAPGDQVFIYFSGHGTRQRVTDPNERCAEALVTVDGEGFTDTEMEAQLKRLSSKSQKIIALLDACHSGGVSTRSAGAAKGAPLFSAKFAPRSGKDSCERPVNVLTRSITLQSGTAGSGANNYVYIAAARDNEVSLDMPTRGGVATQAWRDCMTGAVDRDGSGGLSAEEIRLCAQDRINAMLKGVQGFTPHNVSITGNSRAVLTFADKPLAAAPVAAPVAMPVAAPQKPLPAMQSQKPAAPQVAAPSVPSLPPAFHTLTDVFNSRDDRRVVTLAPSKPAFKIGVDDVSFTLNSTHAGFLYMLMVGSDGKTFDMLFPNQIDSNNAVQAGQPLRLPRAEWQIKAGGPPGKNYLLAIVAESQRDFTRIGMQPAGPFSMVVASPTSSKDIQLVSNTASASASSECAEPPAKRTLQVQRRCSNAYGAAMLTLEEVN
jgi:hypothetical protein